LAINAYEKGSHGLSQTPMTAPPVGAAKARREDAAQQE